MNTLFSAAIAAENRDGYVAIIPDIKCSSPKDGDLLFRRDPVEVSKQLIQYGAPVLSVVTEQKYFCGSPKLLRDVAKSTGVPILRKDFITRADMLSETVELGATAVLLICAITNEKNLSMLYEKALDLGLEPLVEVHSHAEMKLASKLRARLIGINNRDIKVLECDDGKPSLTATLAAGISTGTMLISESSISSADEAKLAVSAGAHAILVGTALWRARDMEAAYRSLRVERNNTCCRQ
ncbi:MAG: indole-3-glycerol-phosphate synthase [Dehalococcoidia bacterium]|nr:indole-3-glycerol-phosphate synthase [Dehalococcoidia bacterium]